MFSFGKPDPGCLVEAKILARTTLEGEVLTDEILAQKVCFVAVQAVRHPVTI